MNQWGEIKKLAIVEADDFQDKYDRNGLEMLFYWKAKYPKFKISLFTIPNRISEEMLELLSDHTDWLEFLVHGWDHESNFECYEWDYQKAKDLIHRVYTKGNPVKYGDRGAFEKFFKAPGWSITPKYNGYPAEVVTNSPLKDDPQAVYRALIDTNFVIFDRHYNKPARPKDAQIVCVDCQEDLIHMHTWNVPADLKGKNGFKDVEELHGVPWNQDTEFVFVSEAWEEGLFKECQP